jgi:hypothetical protein
MRLVRWPVFNLIEHYLSSCHLVIPIGLCSHLMAPTYAIAEKGADIILSKPTGATSDAARNGGARMANIRSSMLVGVVAIMVSSFCAW